jgi:hypothetical protein
MTYKIQIDDIVRNANAEEIEQIKTFQANENAMELESAQRALDKADLLTRLGMTADEAKLLLS